MKKILLIMSLALVLTVAMPLTAVAIYTSPGIENIDEDVSISISGQTVSVYGPQGQPPEVVSLTGRRVLTVKIESPAQKVELNIAKGCYILKIGKVVRKVSVR